MQCLIEKNVVAKLTKGNTDLTKDNSKKFVNKIPVIINEKRRYTTKRVIELFLFFQIIHKGI